MYFFTTPTPQSYTDPDNLNMRYLFKVITAFTLSRETELLLNIFLISDTG